MYFKCMRCSRYTCSHPISLIFFGVFFNMNCLVISALLPGFSVYAFKSDSQPGASSPVIDKCMTMMPALSSSAASILCDFSRSSVDRSIWHLSIKPEQNMNVSATNKEPHCKNRSVYNSKSNVLIPCTFPPHLPMNSSFLISLSQTVTSSIMGESGNIFKSNCSFHCGFNVSLQALVLYFSFPNRKRQYGSLSPLK